MLSVGDILTYKLTDDQFELALKQVRPACIGGISRIRSGDERQNSLAEDNLIGQLTNLALSLYCFGSVEPYLFSREQANVNPHNGDGGMDLPNLKIDVKGSRRRDRDRDLLSYKLPVRPAERHEGWAYVLGIVDLPKIVHLVGWVKDSGLPAAPCSGGVFAGAYVLQARDLRALPPSGRLQKALGAWDELYYGQDQRPAAV